MQPLTDNGTQAK